MTTPINHHQFTFSLRSIIKPHNIALYNPIIPHSDKLICVVEPGKLSIHSTTFRSSHVHHLVATPNHSPTMHHDIANVPIPNDKRMNAIGMTNKFVNAK